MRFFGKVILVCGASLILAQASYAATVVYNRDRSDGATPEPEEATTYVFTTLSPGDGVVPSNSALDLANGVTPVIISGTAHGVSGATTALTNGVGADGTDSPGTNFFFNDNGRIGISLAAVSSIAQVNSYSWHHGSGSRTPQDYTLYAAIGSEAGFVLNSAAADPTTQGYTLITAVNSDTIIPGGANDDPAQHGVSINPTGPATSLGNFRHFIFDIRANPEGTFYSEIDIVAVPEPSCVVVLGLGGFVVLGRRRQS